MNFSLPPMLLYGIILFAAIATGMENKESDQVAPNVIEIKGRIGLNSDVINGYYFKADELYNGRVYYQNKLKSTFVSWNRKSQCWSIDRGFGSIRYMAKLQEDVLFPTLATKYWIFFDGAGKGRKKDENVVVEKIDDRRTLLILQDPEILTVTLEPRPLGLRANWTTGTGITVNSDCQTQLKQLGTGEDWEIYLVDFEPYNEPLLDEKMKGDKSYDLSFIKKIKKETETLRKI